MGAAGIMAEWRHCLHRARHKYDNRVSGSFLPLGKKHVPIPDTQLRECLGAVGAFLEKRRPPPEIRDQLDLRSHIVGAEVVIVEVRPAYQDEKRTVEHPVAKAKWVGARKVWKLYWMRADLKWHSYEPLPEATTMRGILDEVDRDPHGCFFG